MKSLKIFLSIVLISTAFASSASVEKAGTYYNKNKRSTKYYPFIAEELIKDNLYFSAVPFIKEYLSAGKSVKSKKIDAIIDELIINVGIKQFESLSIRALSRSNAQSLKYIQAKKYFSQSKYNRALKAVRGVYDENHPAKPFALLIEGSIYALLNKNKSAVFTFKKCIESSESRLSDTDDINEIKQLKMNRDYCIVGIPRAEFASGKFESAKSHYMDLPKNSHVWPEILFEEAWTSFYLKNYNRTLGKLVTYNAPIFDYLFNPEVDILTALTYMELCLWQDAKGVVDKFYKKYSADEKRLRNELRKAGKNYKYFYKIGKSRIDGKVSSNELKNTILKAVIGDTAYGEMYMSFQGSAKELSVLKEMPKSGFKRVLVKGLKDTLLTQRNLIGSYVRVGMHDYMSKMKRAFEGMSYIKLEVLARKKAQVYDINYNMNGKRGDIKNIKRTDKQYFWDFNGEFWADELGDYVFSLKTACNK